MAARLQADPNVLGRAVTLDDRSFTIVGVSPRGFWFTQAADAYVPLRPSGSMADNGFNTAMIARLKPGITVRRANAEMPAVMENFRRAHPDPNAVKDRAILLTPFQESLTENVRTTLWLLMGAVALLLVIACSNLGSLLLARLSARQKEIAVRLALGSGAGRLLRQFLVESMLLAVAGSAAGFLAAYWSFGALLALVPLDLPSSVPIRPDLPVLGFAAIVALAAGACSVCRLSSRRRAWICKKPRASGRSAELGGTAAGAECSGSRRSGAIGDAAGLRRTADSEPLPSEPGAPGLLAAWPAHVFDAASAGGYRTGPDPEFQAAVVERLRALPGVRAVAAVNVLPLTGQSNFPAQQEGNPEHSIGGMEIR